MELVLLWLVAVAAALVVLLWLVAVRGGVASAAACARRHVLRGPLAHDLGVWGGIWVVVVVVLLLLLLWTRMAYGYGLGA